MYDRQDQALDATPEHNGDVGDKGTNTTHQGKTLVL